MYESIAVSVIFCGFPFLKWIDSKKEAIIVGPDLDPETFFTGQEKSNQSKETGLEPPLGN